MPAPIDIASRPQQPGQPKSNLTSQLRAAGGLPMPMNESYGRSGSITQGMSMAGSRGLRRESMVNGELARSFLNNGGGMSWGGVSVGSWIRDDIVMTGTSPFTLNSPSYHSSSYLPKLEAEFCRDFSCCGIPLPSLHDLLRHYEEHHAQQIPIGNEDENQDGAGRHDANRQQSRHTQQSAGMTSPMGTMGGIQYEMMRQQQMQRQRLQDDDRENSQDDQQDGEIAGDMEMDDDMTPPPSNSTGPITPQGQQLPQQHYSHPSTPQTISHPSYHNTPNLANAQLAHLTTHPSHFSPDSSVPGTPLGNEQLDYSFPPNLGPFQSQQGGALNQMMGYGGGMDGSGDVALDLCIDEPAKRLYSPGGQAYTQAPLQQFINNGNAMLGKKLGDGGVMQSPIMPATLMQTEDKPFKCPVIGCEKAYKNQNGLKYHKAHGHTNQQLHDNADGTFSIVNPETSAPYPGTLGMEKEKPYRCEYCGKRYKNLNGLKYHRSHSTHPNATGLPPPPQPSQQPVPGGVVAVAGGIGETGMGVA